MSLHIFHQNQNKTFSSLLKTSLQESLEFLQNKFALNRCQNDFCVWNSFEIPKVLHENNSLSNLPSHSLIPKPDLNTWGHDQAGEHQKIHGRASSMIPFLRKMSGKIGNPNDKGAEDKEVSNQSSLLTL
jgi:hypothetical protein